MLDLLVNLHLNDTSLFYNLLVIQELSGYLKVVFIYIVVRSILQCTYLVLSDDNTSQTDILIITDLMTCKVNVTDIYSIRNDHLTLTLRQTARHEDLTRKRDSQK